MIRFLDLESQYRSIKGEIDAAIERVIRNTAFVGGSEVAGFEAEFAAYQQAAHCVGVGNGTDAIEILLEALALPAGSEVIVPANSFIASSEAVTRSGHRVVFADVDESYTLDVEDVRARLTSRTRAIIAVHLYGQPCDLDGLGSVAREHGVHLIEDAAQAHGAEYRGHRCGAIGVAGTFSFYPGKNLGAYGDAGAVVTNDEELAKRCRMIANHGRIDKYNHEFEGRNSRLDSIQAAVLRAKLPFLDGWVEARNAVATAYRDRLDGVGDLRLPAERPMVRHAYHLFVVRSKLRDPLRAHLSEDGIQTGIHYPIALPKLPAYRYLGAVDAPLFANHVDGELLSLPIGEHLSMEDVKAVCDSIERFFKTA